MILRAALLALAAMAAAPAFAQSVGPADPNAPPAPKPVTAPGEVSHDAPVNGVLYLYGNQRCPTNSEGSEVVVCVHRRPEEQFRIPKDLRDFKVTPQNESWARQQAVTLAAGQGGTGSCTAVGPGGNTGCFGQQAQATRADNKERKKDENPDLSHY